MSGNPSTGHLETPVVGSRGTGSTATKQLRLQMPEFLVLESSAGVTAFSGDTSYLTASDSPFPHGHFQDRNVKSTGVPRTSTQAHSSWPAFITLSVRLLTAPPQLD